MLEKGINDVLAGFRSALETKEEAIRFLIYCWLAVSSHGVFVWTAVNCLDASVLVNNEMRVALSNSNQRLFIKWQHIMFICPIAASASTICRWLLSLSPSKGRCGMYSSVFSLARCQSGYISHRVTRFKSDGYPTLNSWDLWCYNNNIVFVHPFKHST